MNLICCSNFSLTLPRWSSSTRLVEWCLPQGLEVVATAHWTTWLVVQLAGDGQGRLYYMYTSGVKIYMMLCINILLHFCSYWPCLGETVCLRLPPIIETSKFIWRRHLYWIGVCQSCWCTMAVVQCFIPNKPVFQVEDIVWGWKNDFWIEAASFIGVGKVSKMTKFTQKSAFFWNFYQSPTFNINNFS